MRHALIVAAGTEQGRKQNLTRAFYGQRLRGLSFENQDLTSLRVPALLWLDRCSFDGADLRQATLDGLHLKLCTLRGADLRGASLRGVYFAGCDLTGADLRGADLRGASFASINTGNNSGRTVLSGARLDRNALQDAMIDADTVLPLG